MENKMMPLEGIKVVELATVVAAPTTGRMLCAFGAEVIKVEALRGDEHRNAGDFEFVVCEGDKNPLFTVQNSGKTLTSINLKDPKGLEAMLRLLADADVFLTNVRLPSLKRLGLGYEDIKERFPQLIYAHFSGFGTTGPDCAKPGFDFTAFWIRNGPLVDWQEPGAFPFTPTYAFGDMATSSAFLSGILMALIGREKSGRGTFISTSLMASGIWCNAIGVVSHQKQFAGDRPIDNLRPADPFYHFYKCRDGRYIGVADNEYKRELPKFAALFNLPYLLEDESYATLENLSKTDKVKEVTETMNGIFAQKDSDEWIKFLEENNVSCERMGRMSEVCNDPQALANGYMQEVEFRDGLKVKLPCPPVQFSEYDMRPYTPAGVLGADTDAVFAGMGYSSEEIQKLKDDKVII